MRIIGGELKGLKFHPPDNIPTRPTTDFAKEGLFNVLNNYYNFDRIKVLDLFGGTGSLTYEFYSRGCRDITTVEIFPKCCKFIAGSIERFNMQGVKLVQNDVFDFMRHCNEQFDVIFAGPPYALETLDSIPDIVFERQLVEGAGWFIMEHNPNHNFEQHAHFSDKRNYGTTIFSIFTNHE